jgi:hypothetical protein
VAGKKLTPKLIGGVLSGASQSEVSNIVQRKEERRRKHGGKEEAYSI